MKPDTPIIYVLDDDYRVREALSSLLLSMGHRVEVFASAAEYLVFKKPDSPACLILDLDLPGMSGLELQREIAGPRYATHYLSHRARRCSVICTCDEGGSYGVSVEAF